MERQRITDVGDRCPHLCGNCGHSSAPATVCLVTEEEREINWNAPGCPQYTQGAMQDKLPWLLYAMDTMYGGRF